MRSDTMNPTLPRIMLPGLWPWLGLALTITQVSSSQSVGNFTATDHCHSNPCLHGVCLEQDSHYRCFCFDGYTGQNCSVDFNECLPGRNRCQNNATCINDIPDGRCLCPEGFCGKYCETEINECDSNPCLNGAMCVDQVNSYRCICQPGYSGTRCEIDIDVCTTDLGNGTSHCENGATCKDGPGEEYFCICPVGYSGRHCEITINECDSSPCLNQGLCVKNGNGFKCVCPYGWAGQLCQGALKLCTEVRCHNQALCMESLDDPGEFYCFCPPDFHGHLCELRFNECEPNECQNGATCVDQIDSYQCLCASGFVGIHCEIDCTQQKHELCVIVTTTPETIETVIPSTSTESPVTPSNLPNVTAVALPTTTANTTEVMVPITSTTTIPEITSEPSEMSASSHIYAASFNGINSQVVFQVRRVKRRSSSIQLKMIAENDDGILLHASTPKLILLIVLKNLRPVVTLLDQTSTENLLRLESSVAVELFKPYELRLVISSSTGWLRFELTVLSDQHVIDTVLANKSNMTVPCFELFQLGQSSSMSSMHLEPFKGCIYNLIINEEEKFVRDAVQVRNVTECLEGVCTQKPCRNGGVCEENVTRDWHCSCSPGFRGWLCEEAFCDVTFCANGGLCLLENQNKHLCLCSQGFYGSRCELKMNLTFPMFNLGTNNSFIKYRLPQDLTEFLEIRFRFIAHELHQTGGLLMFMSATKHRDFLALIYEQQSLLLRINLGQGERVLKAPTEANVTEQMVLLGRYRQLFWLLVVPTASGVSLRPQVGRAPPHHAALNVEPYLHVGGHEDWLAHALLYNLTGFKGCIYDIDIRVSRSSNFTRLNASLIDNLANIDQCDFECT